MHRFTLMTRAIFCLSICFGLPLHAQMPESPVGAVVSPKAPVVLFEAPPSNVFRQAPQAKGVFQPSGGRTAYYKLHRDGAAPGGYALDDDPTRPSGPLVVTDYVDVYQGKDLNRWIRVAPEADGNPAAAAQPEGWTLWGPAGAASRTLTLSPATNGGQ